MGELHMKRWTHRRFHRVLPEFAECVWYLRPESAGVDKLASRWEDGIFLGIREESGELLMGNDRGVLKVNAFKWRPEANRWNVEELEKMNGVP